MSTTVALSALFLIAGIIASWISRRVTTDIDDSFDDLPVFDKLSTPHRTTKDRIQGASLVLTPFRCFVIGTAGAIFVLVTSANLHDVTISSLGWFESALLGLIGTLQVFVAGSDASSIIERINAVNIGHSRALVVYVTMLHTLAPILTVGLILSMFQAVSSACRYLLKFRRTANVFSELNHESLALARSIRQRDPSAAIVFTDVILANNEPSIDLIISAKRLGAIFVKNDLLDLRFNIHSKRALVRFFIMGSNELENLHHATQILNSPLYRNREHTDLYLFSSSLEAEIALRDRPGKIHIRRINPAKSLIHHWLWRAEGDGPAGIDIFRNIELPQEGADLAASEHIIDVHLAIVGLGEHGGQMARALAWAGQIATDAYRYRFNIHLFDHDETRCQAFETAYPGLFDDRLAHAYGTTCEDSLYRFVMHSGIDVHSHDFIETIATIDALSFVFISLGDDSLNLETAVHIRQELARKAQSAAHEHTGVRRVTLLTMARNARQMGDILKFSQEQVAHAQAPTIQIELFGDYLDTFSYETVITSALEHNGLLCHMRWAGLSSQQWHAEIRKFWESDYHYSSSIASPIAWRLRKALNVPGANLLGTDRSEEQREFLNRLEHARWCAFMRSEGFTYSTQRDTSIAKTHYCLVNFSELSERDKDKDDNDSCDVLPMMKQRLLGDEADEVEPALRREFEQFIRDAEKYVQGQAM